MPFVQSSPEGNLNQFGWPHFQGEGSAVASLANAIAAQKYKQTQDFQKTLAQSIQDMADERAANAALETAGATEGLPAPGSLEGMGTAGYRAYAGKKGIAELVQEQQLRDLQEKLWGAHAQYYQQGGAGGRGKIEDPDAPGQYMTPTQLFNRRKSQAGVFGQQAKAIESEQKGYGLPANVPGGFGYMKKDDGSLRYAETDEEQKNPDVVSPTDILKYNYDPNKPAAENVYPPMFTKDVYTQRQARSTEHQKALESQKAIQDKMLNTAPDAGDQGGGTAGLRAQAQSAIAQGAPEDKVRQRFKDQTGEDL